MGGGEEGNDREKGRSRGFLLPFVLLLLLLSLMRDFKLYYKI